MKNFDIYLEVFNKLNNLYFSDKQKYDNFGILLGQMSPDTFENSYSADPAWFSSFSKNLDSLNIDIPTVKDGLDVMFNMILEYNHPPYNISSVIEDYKKLYN